MGHHVFDPGVLLLVHEAVGLGAEAEDNGESRVAINGSKYTFKSTGAYFQAANTPRARALAVNAAVGLSAFQVSESIADVKAKALSRLVPVSSAAQGTQ